MKQVIIAIIALTALSGCTLRHVESDVDAQRYKDVWQMGQLGQRLIELNLTAENVADPSAGAAVAAAFLNTAKFKIARAGEQPEFIIDVTIRESRTTFAGRTALGALVLYAVPVHSQRHISEVIVKVRDFTGREFEPIYAQSRGKTVLWLGYALWPAWIWNSDRAAIIRDDTIKAAVVKTARTIAIEAEN